jgi:flavin reductase (DIM6/NTAB) family NADH-FMN oxidoreductase RutF
MSWRRFATGAFAVEYPQSRPAFDKELRRTLGSFATGVTVVTTRDAAGIIAGITINSFNSLSLRPPMVLWSLGADRVRAGTFQSCKTYAINVLADDQEPLSRRFAQRSQDDPFAGVSYTNGLGGAPLLKGCCAWLEVHNASHHRHGDHILFVGTVERLQCAATAPLIFHGGRYRRLAAD